MKIPLRARTMVNKFVDHSAKIISVANMLAQMSTKPGLLNKAGLAVGIVAALAYRSSLPQAFERFSEAHFFQSIDVSAIMEPYVIAWPTEEYEKRDKLRFYSFQGIDCVGYFDLCKEWLWVEPGVDIRRMLAEHIWGDSLDLEIVAHRGDNSLRFESHERTAGFTSNRATAIWARVEPFVRVGHKRSVLLDGRPGTGKSTIVRWLATQVGGRCLRVSATAIARMSAETLSTTVAWLQPDVVTIDDFDRTTGHGGMLTAIEEIRAAVKLFVVSTNNLAAMDAAVVRPKRFDELVTVDSLGDTFVREYLDAVWTRLTPDMQAKVLLWPIAYLEELRDRAHHLPSANIVDEAQQLEERLAVRVVPDWAARMRSHISLDSAELTT